MSSDCTVMPVPALAGLNPASTSMRAWSAVPVAPPPGVMRLNELPASWVVTTGNQPWVRKAMRWSIQVQPKLANSKRRMTGTAAGWTSPSLFQASNTSAMLGANR